MGGLNDSQIGVHLRSATYELLPLQAQLDLNSNSEDEQINLVTLQRCDELRSELHQCCRQIAEHLRVNNIGSLLMNGEFYFKMSKDN